MTERIDPLTCGGSGGTRSSGFAELCGEHPDIRAHPAKNRVRLVASGKAEFFLKGFTRFALQLCLERCDGVAPCFLHPCTFVAGQSSIKPTGQVP
jgi:hypothetical protein